MLRTVIYSVGIALSSQLIFLTMTPALLATEPRFLDTNRTTPIVEEPGDDEESDAASTGLRSTRHWKHTSSYPANRREKQSERREYIEEKWLNLETGESYRQNRRVVSGVEVLTNEAVYDGRHAKLVYHEQKEVYFIELSPIQSQMEKRLHKGELLRRAYVGHPQRSKRFRETGEGTIAGTRCEIWSGEVPTSNPASKHRVRAWLDPETDELLRLETDNEHTGEQQTYILLERDQPIPAEFMKLHVPNGFTQINKRDEPKTQKVAWGGFGTGAVKVSLIFTMPDGTLLLASSLEGPNTAGRVLGMVKGLETGTALPVVEYGDPKPDFEWYLGSIRTIGLVEEIEFAGHHLMYTEDEDGCHEWSIHVPVRKLPDLGEIYGYAIPAISGRSYFNGRLNMADSHTVDTWEGFSIRNHAEFREFVIAAMQEYSTAESDKSYPDFETVLKLATTIRDSLQD